MTPVGMAASKGYLNTLDVMCRKVEAQQGSRVCRRPRLRHASFNSHFVGLAAVEQIVEVETGEMKKSLLHHAVESKDTKIVMYVLHRKANLMAKVSTRPLHIFKLSWTICRSDDRRIDGNALCVSPWPRAHDKAFCLKRTTIAGRV